MKSIKPGRGPSRLGVAGGIFAMLFGIFWCIMAVSIGAGFMIPFGILFIGFAGYSTLYNYHNATSKDRFSVVDIVDEDEEPDPLNEIFMEEGIQPETAAAAGYCPYCGTGVGEEFEFCPKCGKKLPD